MFCLFVLFCFTFFLERGGIIGTTDFIRSLFSCPEPVTCTLSMNDVSEKKGCWLHFVPSCLYRILTHFTNCNPRDWTLKQLDSHN